MKDCQGSSLRAQYVMTDNYQLLEISVIIGKYGSVFYAMMEGLLI